MKTNSHSIMNKTTFLNVTFELWDQVLGIIATNNHKFQGPLQVFNFYELKFESRRKTFYFLTQNRVVERIFNQIYHQWSTTLTLSTNCQRTITCSIRWNCPLLSFFSQAHAVVVTAAMFAPVPWLIVPPDSSVHQTTTEVLVTADWSGAIKLFVNRWHAAALIWNIGGNCLAGLESPRHVVIQILCLTWWSTQIVNGNYVTIFFAYPRRTPVYQCGIICSLFCTRSQFSLFGTRHGSTLGDGKRTERDDFHLTLCGCHPTRRASRSPADPVGRRCYKDLEKHRLYSVTFPWKQTDEIFEYNNILKIQ